MRQMEKDKEMTRIRKEGTKGNGRLEERGGGRMRR